MTGIVQEQHIATPGFAEEGRDLRLDSLLGGLVIGDDFDLRCLKAIILGQYALYILYIIYTPSQVCPGDAIVVDADEQGFLRHTFLLSGFSLVSGPLRLFGPLSFDDSQRVLSRMPDIVRASARHYCDRGHTAAMMFLREGMADRY
jgi:hypothetical protein